MMASAWRFLAAIDGVENFLLGEAMVVGETFRVNQFAAEFDEALLETFRLGDAAQRRDFFPLQQFQALPFAGENVFEIKRVMNAFDDSGGGIVARQFACATRPCCRRFW